MYRKPEGKPWIMVQAKTQTDLPVMLYATLTGKGLYDYKDGPEGTIDATLSMVEVEIYGQHKMWVNLLDLRRESGDAFESGYFERLDLEDVTPAHDDGYDRVYEAQYAHACGYQD